MRFTAVVAVACAACAPPRGPAPADPCARDDAGWRQWQHAAVTRLLEPTLEHDGRAYVDTAVTASDSATLIAELSSCPQAPAMTNLRRFTRAMAREARPGHELGLVVPDLDYITAQRPNIALPPLLTSQPFLRALAAPATYRDAYRMIEARNAAVPADQRWDLLLYESQFLTTPDHTTYGRFLVRVPGAELERWIQFGIEVPDSPVRGGEIHSASIVSVRGGGQFTIADYWRSARDDGGIDLATRVESGNGGSNCYNCHKAAVLPIHPAHTYDFDDGGDLIAADRSAVVDALNARIRGYGPPAFDGALDPGDYGPPLGPPRRQRSGAFLAACAAELDAGARARVAAEMRCAQCHNGTTLGAINMPQAMATDQDVRELRHPHTGTSMALPATYVREGWMPPDNQLTVAERHALARCLELEYRDLVRAWLLE